MMRRNLKLFFPLAGLSIVVGAVCIVLLADRPLSLPAILSSTRSQTGTVSKGGFTFGKRLPKANSAPHKKVDSKMLEAAIRAMQPVALRQSQVVATVNGVSIRANEVLFFDSKDGDQKSMSPAMYRMLLDRAIDRELVKQAAKENQVELGQTQLQQLAAHKKRLEDHRGIKDPGLLAFEVQDAQGQLLLATLGEKEGIPSAFPDEKDVQRYYEAHKEGYGDLPSDPKKRQVEWQRIDQEIRQVLAGEMRAANREGIRKYLDSLRAGADISES